MKKTRKTFGDGSTFQKIPVKKKVKAISEWQSKRKANRKAKLHQQEQAWR